MTFWAGIPVQPFSVGCEAQWSVEAENVSPEHLFLCFDGETLFASAPEGVPVPLVAGRPLGVEWAPLVGSCELSFGRAKLSFITQVVRESAPPPPAAPRAPTSNRPAAPASWSDDERTVVKSVSPLPPHDRPTQTAPTVPHGLRRAALAPRNDTESPTGNSTTADRVPADAQVPVVHTLSSSVSGITHSPNVSSEAAAERTGPLKAVLAGWRGMPTVRRALLGAAAAVLMVALLSRVHARRLSGQQATSTTVQTAQAAALPKNGAPLPSSSASTPGTFAAHASAESGGAHLQRDAVNAFAQGNFDDAARAYASLAALHPGAPAFRTAQRVAERKARPTPAHARASH